VLIPNCLGVLQFGADVDALGKTLCRVNHGQASGPLRIVVDLLDKGERRLWVCGC
jgi:hypothetical protein